jgi:predicted aconitase
MVKLTEYEQEMLDGKHGALKKQAMTKVVEYANVLGAEELCEVTMAHVFCGAHGYLSAAGKEDVNETVSEMQFCSDQPMPDDPYVCYCQADCGPMDPINYSKMNVTPEEGARNSEFLKYYLDRGVNLVGTCVPYMCGFIPLPGEHYVSSESHAVTLMNSMWGACGNSDGLEMGFWGAACGRVPKWGNHLMDCRKGTHLFNIKTPIVTACDWDLLGYTIGRHLPPHSIPVINELENRPNIFNVKYFFAAMATTSGPEMCHFVGITPEAPTLEAAFGGKEPVAVMDITRADLDESYEILNGHNHETKKVDYISLGCPHYSIEELRYVAGLLKGKKVADGTVLHVWTAQPIKATSDFCGYTKTIEESGAILLTSSCPLTSDKMPPNTKVVAFDSAKQAHYIAPQEKAQVVYGSLEKCIQSAISGIWEAD